MINWSKIIGVIVCIVLQTGIVFSQSKIQLIDEKSSEPIYLAHIKFTNIKSSKFQWTVSDENGFALNPYNDSTIIEISYTGYEKKIIEVVPSSQTQKISLKKVEFGLSELVITANFIPIELKESVYDIQVIDEQKISSKGAQNLREVLNTELNFRTNNGHANETSINMNGLSGNHIKIMVDGVPVEGRLNESIDLSQLNLSGIEKVEVIDGPTSVAYGTNALGGTINLISKKNQDKKVAVHLKSFYETVGQYNASAEIGYKYRENLFKLNLSRNFFDGFANPDTSRFKSWKPREQYFGSFQYSKKIKHLHLTYILDGFNETMTSRGERRPPYYVTAFDTYYLTNRISNKVLLAGRISPSNYINLALSHSYYNRIRNIYFKDLTTLNQIKTDSENDQDSTKFNTYLFRGVFTHKNDSNPIHYMYGIELKRDEILAQRIQNNNQWVGDYAIFAGIDYKPIKQLTIKPAARYAYNTIYSAPLVPSLNILYDFNENWQIRTSVAKGFRAPDLKELFMEFHYSSTINLYGNTKLTAENSDHFQFSVNYSKAIREHKIQINPKLYYSKINNLIGLTQISDVDWKYQNIDYLITRGSSINLNYRINIVAINVGYNYFGNYNSLFDEPNFQNKFHYTSDANSGIAIFLDSLKMSFHLNYKYTGLIRNSYITDQKFVKESYIGDYHTFDLNVSKLLFKEKVTFSFGIKNIFDTKEIPMIGDVYGVSNQSNASSLNVLWGRSYFFSLNFKI